jgi:exodeoxyribonuclease VII small subunit
MNAQAANQPADPAAGQVAGQVAVQTDAVADGYASALAELEEILGQLERSDVDVDTLATQVQRASELISFCRERIANARLRIDQVVAGLDD